MNERLTELKRKTRNGYFKQYRKDISIDIEQESIKLNLSWPKRAAHSLRRMCEEQTPVVLPDERIVFTRTVNKCPEVPIPTEITRQAERDNYHVGNGAANICSDWQMILAEGLHGRKKAALESRKRIAANYNDVSREIRDRDETIEFLDAAIESIDTVLALAYRYSEEARRNGRDDMADILQQVPGNSPRSFHEALQSLRFLQASLWLTPTAHVTLGRFDQYMWPYLKADLQAGRLDIEAAEVLLAEFFISLNRDSDLYPGVQVGDNGQSMMLGGVTREGEDAVNELTWTVLRVSCKVNMIDPKINLRVTKNTDMALLTEAARLTKRGLGFPQYSNDDVVIPGLARHGYSLEDARDYTVAACWEYIIPGCGMDIPNIDALSFPHASHVALCEGLKNHKSFEWIMHRVKEDIAEQVERYVERMRRVKARAPSPLYSCYMTGCLERARDVMDGGVAYYNYGIHGSGSSNAADALAAVKKFVFEEQMVDGAELLEALESSWENHEELRQRVMEDGPKVGNNDDDADSIMKTLFDYFSDACESIKDNGKGGTVRPGTGTAMYYISLADVENHPEIAVGATADGRKDGDFFSSSLAPSPGIKTRGPISMLQTYGKIDYSRVCNGGPITMELSDTVFRDEEALGKVAMLVRSFAGQGCQQLQLNTLNPEILRDAKVNPENHKNLIVRVWGWSGYFVELDEPYQNHIINRVAYAL